MTPPRPGPGDDPDPGAAGPDADEYVDDLMAALAAGTLDPQRARLARARLASDPELLAAYGALRVAQLATPAQPPAPPDPPGPTTPGGSDGDRLRHRATPARLSVVGGTAVVVAAAVAGLMWLGPSTAGPRVAAADTSPVMTITANQLPSLWPALQQAPPDLGFLTEQGRLPGCFGVLGEPLILGARPIVVDDRYGVAVAGVRAEDPTTVEIVVFSRACGPFDDAVIARAATAR